MFFNTVLDALFNETQSIPSKHLKKAREYLNGSGPVAVIVPDHALSYQIPQAELYSDEYLLSHLVSLDQAKFSGSKHFVAPTFMRNTYAEFADKSVSAKASGSGATQTKPVRIVHVYCWNPGVSYIASDRIFFLFALEGLFLPLKEPPRAPLLTRFRTPTEPADAGLSAASAYPNSKTENLELSTLIGKDKAKLKRANTILGELLANFGRQHLSTAQQIVQEYRELVDRAHTAMLEIGVDDYHLVSEQLECHMGFRISEKLRFCFAESEFNINLQSLKDLDVSQVELPPGVNLAKCELLVNRVVEIFESISMWTVISDICTVLVRVMDSLGEADVGTSVSADALIGLFLLVIVRAKSGKRLEVYLYMIRHMAYFRRSLDRGQLGYTLMTAESALHHIKYESDDIRSRAKVASDFWTAVESGSLENVKALPDHTIFNARRTSTALFLCIRRNFMDIFDYILDSGVLSTQDILDDRDEKGTTLLMAALKNESGAITRILSILCTLSESEQRQYFQQHDKLYRNVGHYMFHRADLIKPLGKYIDWTAKDVRSRSALLTLAVCYDHPEYDQMIIDALDAICLQNPDMSLLEHLTSDGTSFLHLVNPHTPELMHRVAKLRGFDVTLLDHKLRSPLSVSLRFDRKQLVDFLLKEGNSLLTTDFFFNTVLVSDNLNQRLLDALRRNPDSSQLALPEIIMVSIGGSIKFEFTKTSLDATPVRRNFGDFVRLRAALQIKHPISWQPALGHVDERWMNSSVSGREYSSSVANLLLEYLSALRAHSTMGNSPEFIAFCTDPKWSGDQAVSRADQESQKRLEPVVKQQNFDGTEKIRFFEQESRSIDTFFRFSIEQMQGLMQQFTRLASSMQHLMNSYMEDTLCMGHILEEISCMTLEILEPLRGAITSVFRQNLQHVYWRPRIVCASLALNSARIVESLSLPVQMIKELGAAQAMLKAEREQLAELGSRKAWPLTFFEDRRLKDMHETEDRISGLRSTIARLMSRITLSQEILACELSSFMAYQERALLDITRVVAISQIDSLKQRLAKMEFVNESLKKSHTRGTT